MPDLIPIVESLDGVDESLRSYYSEMDGGGGFRLNVAPTNAWELVDTTGLKGAVQNERKLRTAMEKQHKEAAARAASLEAELAEVRSSSGKDEAGIAARIAAERKRWDEDAGTKIKAAGEKVASYHAQLERALVGSVLAEAFDGVRVDPNYSHLLRREVAAHVKMQETDGGVFTAAVVDQRGELRYNSDGKPMTVRDLVSEMQRDAKYRGAFLGPESSGGGQAGHRGADGAGSVRISAADARDIKKYAKAKQEAERRGVPLTVDG